jgi:stage II sporulation protein E
MLKWNGISQLVLPGKREAVGTKLQSYVQGHRFIRWLSLKRWNMILLAIAFLLGRAMILEQLSPFAIAFFAVIYFLRREMLTSTAFFLFAGSLLSVEPRTGYIVTEMIVFLLLQKGIERYERSDITFAPLLVFVSVFMVQLFSQLVDSQLTWFTLMMTGVEAALSLILTLIFIQAIPVFTLSRKNYHLKNEEIVCLMILLASVMTGTVGWVIEGVSIEHVLSRYLILLFALVGGAPMGASVGVVTGLILSLANVQAVYQMSLLAFSGMLAGLLKEGRKVAVAFGMLLGTSILTVYLANQAEVIHSTWESVIAVLLFLATPRGLIQTVAKYVPGTQENMKTQQDYAKRVRDITAGRVEQFSEVFQQLSKSFKQLTGQEEQLSKDEEVGHFMNSVANKTCAHCWKKDKCWNDQFYTTYKYMTDMMTSIDENPAFSKKSIPSDWKKVCLKSEQVLELMKQQYEMYKNNLRWKRQIHDSRQLVSEQLSGVSQVMEDLAREIKREGHELFLQEEQIRHALEELGLLIYSIDIVSLDPGNVEIELVHQYTKGFDECRKIIAPLLSDILGENIAVKSEEYVGRGEGYYTVTLGSAKEFEVDTGIAGAAKGGDLLSGDSFSTVELGNGKFAVAISDGMGNGERARAESSAALSILQQLLQSGMDERLAIKSVNSVLVLRSSDEVFATVDLALIDQYTAKTTFMKIGSTPSFVKRGDEVISISANNLPIGILKDIDVDLVSMQLASDDILIMMTDGIYDAPGHAVNKELWMKRVIADIRTDDPQQFADVLLETVVRHSHGQIADDMTVVVAKVTKFQPEWATFRWPGLSKLERPKTVS